MFRTNLMNPATFVATAENATSARGTVEITIGGETRRVLAYLDKITEGGIIRLSTGSVALKYLSGRKVWKGWTVYRLASGVECTTGGMINPHDSEPGEVVGFYDDIPIADRSKRG